ncbi:MAG: phospholipase D family protein [Xanthomonadales bacterium]|jgi:putative cardiolipin synthase|nr:phospholipase D family protein [Xanthomonadales bacterium]
MFQQFSLATAPARGFLPLWAAVTALLLAACAGPSLKKEIVRFEPTYAKPPAETGILHELASGVTREHGEEFSGFRLLDHSYDGLAARLALIDSAVSSLDIQTYLWYPDNSGRLILERAIHAADRGVHVRLIVDDLLTIGQDQLIYELDQRPNVELRLFNPWKDRSTLSRGGEMIAEMERLNTRMHDKLLIADGNAAVVGGRNIGDHYFGLSHDYNFHDCDLLGFGHIARQANAMFDHFWNSQWVVSAVNLDVESDPEYVKKAWADLQAKNRASEELTAFGVEARDWREEAVVLASELHIGESLLVYDETGENTIAQNVVAKMFGFMGLAQKELLITNAYIIPGQASIDFLKSLTDRGVSISILTNSLASHDVPAVNSHYRGWRDDLINAGVELHELRADPAIQSIVDIPPVKGKFTGLHTKAVVVDREYVFVGSMNFDPRSANINTEAGAFVRSPGLAEELAGVMERDMQPENAWQVLLDDTGKLYWVNSDETLDQQPARGFSQRIMDVIFKVVPKEQY